MIKFFRKIRFDLMEQNKTGKYFKYAIGEIILVVIGILIALQINNWNEERKKSLKENYYLNSIKSSIQLSQKELSRVIGDAELISSCADTLFLIIAKNKTEQLNGKFLDSLLFNAGDYSLISLNDGGIQEILNTGSLDLIKDDRIRLHLASWGARLHKIRKFEGDTEKLAQDYQKYIKDYIDVKRIISRDPEGLIIPGKKMQLLADPIFTNYLARIASIHEGMYEMYTEEKEVMDSLVLLIDSYLVND